MGMFWTISRPRTLCLILQATTRAPFWKHRVCPLSTEVLATPNFIECTDSENSFDFKSLTSRVEKLERRESIVYAFQSYMSEGFPVQRGDVFHTINRLRKLRKYKRALEVMEWVIRERPYKLKELDYSCLLEFTVKIHGISRGETLFSRIPVEFHNELLYNNLTLSCLDKGAITLALAYMKKMRELGFPLSPLIFNRLILLHSSRTQKKKIPKILTQMKADGVTPTTCTYNILVNIEAQGHDMEGLVKVFDEMRLLQIEPNEITYCILALAHAVARLHTVAESYVEAIERAQTGRNWSTLDVLLTLYGYLGKEKELEATWELVLKLPHIRRRSFLVVIEAFGRFGHVKRAEEIWSEMKREKELGFTEQFNSLISVYGRHGLVSKASEMFRAMRDVGCEPNAITYRHLAIGCLKAGLVKEAMKTLGLERECSVSCRVRRSAPWLESTLSIVEMFSEMGDVENAKKFFEELKESGYSRYTFAYNTMLRAYVKAKVYYPDFLKEMIVGGGRPDAETYSLVRLLEEFKT
ncbi:hypothetical protein AMTR_s00047p00194260 [Amborella trichopoda]|uniref:Pentacotripeptide-repeat region of PRORP domain-containing protein n=2 Tax=Amborella trichopoda TaxID=13333 RepID=U5CWX9_AMBTC|nr:hypothetical protein AMTR_s00047p00194260 [Amborella trichopoda]